VKVLVSLPQQPLVLLLLLLQLHLLLLPLS
jgi:hypothetical protein